MQSQGNHNQQQSTTNKPNNTNQAENSKLVCNHTKSKLNNKTKIQSIKHYNPQNKPNKYNNKTNQTKYKQ